ncbi:MAG: hypothetical protein Q8Q31_01880 [Nanoarchaeota archaeon]|nr:hypothetical protein [Nanoarchaeota archaeon]
MNKRGQIFLAAALILIILLMSFGVIYNSANAPKGNSRVGNLAKEIKYEALRTIDYGVKEGKNFEQISPLLNSVISNYSSLNSDLLIFGWFYSPSEGKESQFFYEKGASATVPTELNVTKSSDSKYLMIKWNEDYRNIYYNLSLNDKVYNFNVLIERGEKNEKVIAAE